MPMPTLRSVPERATLAMPMISLLAIVAAGLWLAYPQFGLLGEAAAPPAPPAPAAVPTAGPARDPARLARLASSQLFGQPVAEDEAAADEPDAAASADAQAPPPEEPPESLPLASLGITVRGIVFHPESTQRQALLAGAEQQDGLRTYRVGDELPGGASIRFIEPRRVVVERAGALEELPLPRIALDAAPAPRAAATGTPAANRADVAARLRSMARRQGASVD